jgi:hypothetical protein
LAIAAVMSGVRRVAVQEVFTLQAATPIVFVSRWQIDEDDWEPVRERITDEQIRSLNALLALPYVNGHGFDYLSDE